MITAIVVSLTLAATSYACPHPARSPQQVRLFRKSHPCPSTGKTVGRCPGYAVDHVCPLACGGKDRPSNMQWLTTEENLKKGGRNCARWCHPLPTKCG